MRIENRLVVLSVVSGLMGLAAGCSSSSAPAASPTLTGMVAGISTATKNLTTYSPKVDTSSVSSLESTRLFAADWLRKLSFLPEAFAAIGDGFGSNWTAANTVNGNKSAEQFITGELTPSAANKNAFSRYGLGLFVSCFVAASLPSSAIDTDGLAAVGTYPITLTFPNPMPTTTLLGCPIPLGGLSSVGGQSYSGTMTVAAADVTTNYTKTYHLDLSSLGLPGMFMNVKLDSANSLFNFSLVQVGDGNGCGPSRMMLSLNGNHTQFEYESQAFGVGTQDADHGGTVACSTISSFSFYRFDLDTNANKGYMMGANYNAGQGTTRFVVAAAPNSAAAGSGTVAVSSTYGSGQEGNACISTSSGAIATDASLACDVTGIDVGNATADSSTMNGHSATTNDGLGTYTTDASAFISWTGSSDFATAHNSN